MIRVATLAALFLLVPAAGHAQLGEARRRLADADFERAETAYGRALEGRLDRDELVEVYEGRALARWALGDRAGAREDLVALGSLEPDRALPAEAPPALVDAFARSPRAAIAIDVGWHDGTEVTSLRASVAHDDAALVTRVVAHVRRAGEPWTDTDAASVEVRRREGETIEAWLEAIGPGGAVVATEGSALAPIEHCDTPVGVRSALMPPSGSNDATPIWIGVGVGAGVLVVLALAIGLGVGLGNAQSDATQPSAPVVVGF